KALLKAVSSSAKLRRPWKKPGLSALVRRSAAMIPVLATAARSTSTVAARVRAANGELSPEPKNSGGLGLNRNGVALLTRGQWRLSRTQDSCRNMQIEPYCER